MSKIKNKIPQIFCYTKRMKYSPKNAFALLEIIIAISILALLISGGLYLKNSQNKKNIIETGVNAKNQAEDLKIKIENDAKNQKDILDQIN